jgi:hypothetical protein
MCLNSQDGNAGSTAAQRDKWRTDPVLTMFGISGLTKLSSGKNEGQRRRELLDN